MALVTKERRKKAGKGERSMPPMGGMRPRKMEKKGLVTTKSCVCFVLIWVGGLAAGGVDVSYVVLAFDWVDEELCWSVWSVEHTTRSERAP